MKKRSKIVLIGSLIGLIFVFIFTNDSYYAQASIRNWVNYDKKAILEYQQYRIRENARYHNYDTSYKASANDWYVGHDTSPSTWQEGDTN